MLVSTSQVLSFLARGTPEVADTVSGYRSQRKNKAFQNVSHWLGGCFLKSLLEPILMDPENLYYNIFSMAYC